MKSDFFSSSLSVLLVALCAFSFACFFCRGVCVVLGFGLSVRLAGRV